MILVVGSLVAAEGKIETALALSREHVIRSRTEPGCVSHAVHRDIENPRRLIFVEQWSDRAALQAHLQVPASRAFVGAVRELTVEPPRMDIYDANPISF